jgi:predicted site-specific integrase-resolvase
MVACKHRLARCGLELIDWLLREFNTTIVAMHSQDAQPAISNDIVITVFAAGGHGM